MDSSGYPIFISAKAMPDGKLAVAVQRGDDVFIGVVSLNGLNIEPYLSASGNGFNNMFGFQRVTVKMITIGSDFIKVPLAKFDQLSYYKLIPQYQDTKLLE